ncbi:unnamed protein product, partial [marine sediment metagenome]
MLAAKNEVRVSDALKGSKRLGDNEPMDVILGNNGIEVKSIIGGKNPKITMHQDSLARKKAWAKANKSKLHTVVLQGDDVYYRKGCGSFRLSSMEKIDLKTLKGRVLGVPPKVPVGEPLSRVDLVKTIRKSINIDDATLAGLRDRILLDIQESIDFMKGVSSNFFQTKAKYTLKIKPLRGTVLAESNVQRGLVTLNQSEWTGPGRYRKLTEEVAQLYKKGFLAAKTPKDLIIHEWGHIWAERRFGPYIPSGKALQLEAFSGRRCRHHAQAESRVVMSNLP